MNRRVPVAEWPIDIGGLKSFEHQVHHTYPYHRLAHRVATSLLYLPGRLQPRQDEHTWGRPLHTPCNVTRSPADHWGADPAPRPPGVADGSARASLVRLRRVLDPLRCARRDAAPLDGNPPERRDKRL